MTQDRNKISFSLEIEAYGKNSGRSYILLAAALLFGLALLVQFNGIDRLTVLLAR